jgi:hypothetical protein
MFRSGWIVSTATTAYARRRDFGNFRAAEFVVRKRLLPSTDPGRFDLFVNRRIVVPAAGDGASRTLALRPGVYDISEAASAGTNPADYRSNVQCNSGHAGRSRDPARRTRTCSWRKANAPSAPSATAARVRP